MQRILVWYRGRDLRVEDHPALLWAADRGWAVPLLILDPAEPLRGPRGAFRRDAIIHLDGALRALGSRLICLHGDAEVLVPQLVQRWKIQAVTGQRRVEPGWRARDARIEAALSRQGVPCTWFEGDTLVPPGSLRTREGGGFRVFTPFARAFHRQVEVPMPAGRPAGLRPLPEELERECPAGELGASLGSGGLNRMQAFLDVRLEGYAGNRDLMGLDGTSRLSADLRHGTLSVRALWHAVQERRTRGQEADGACFLNELLWREFAHHLLWEMPELTQRPFRPAWADFPWREDAEDLEAWKAGQTGFPVVDAAARELLATGHVHNRARMVAASVMTKHLLLDWRAGEAHYREHLVDGCQAANGLNWQWSAGCGVDAQPWFRIFNPSTQLRRFDPDGSYVRRWVPELAEVPLAHLDDPHAWGRPLDYPKPRLGHGEARDRFLAVAKAALDR